MQALVTASPQLKDFATLLDQADRQHHGSLIVLGCDQNDWPADDLDALLAGTTTPVFGGIFPAIAVNDQRHDHGAIILGLEECPDVACITGMSDPHADYERQLLDQVHQWHDLDEESTLVVLVDGLASRISALVEDLFFVFGLANNFVGGGAGSLSFRQKPCIMTFGRVEADMALVIKLPRASTIGVTHGWSSISETLEVTEADRNIIKSLNWQPAFEAYKLIVDSHSPTPITREAFFEVAKSYPLGLQKLDSKMVVRDPLMVQNGNDLVCVGEVPQGAFIRVLNGNPASLLAAAREARRTVHADRPDSERQLLLFDCISRALFLGHGIEEELRALTAGEPSFGAFTLGEIANSGTDYLEFLNKTTVLACIGRPSR
ncbi:MAG: FIST signal transduction protein [Wenzhouxiangella sp.]